jgi:diphthine synthase
MLVLAGIGLFNLRDIPLGLLSEVSDASAVFVETYTSIIPSFSLDKLSRLLNRQIIQLTRSDIENRGAKIILERARNEKVVLLVVGNPLLATTHASLVIEALKLGIAVKVIPAASVIDGIVVSTGLHVYKFGKIVTLVFPEDEELKSYPYTPYETLKDNLSRGLHTIFLLDIRQEEQRYLTAPQAALLLLRIEEKFKENVLNEDTLAIAVARATAEDEQIFVGKLSDLKNKDLGGPPHSLIIPGHLHYSEIEFLYYRTGTSMEVLKDWNRRLNARKMQRDTS